MIAKIVNITVYRVGEEWGISVIRDDSSMVNHFPVPLESLDGLLAYACALKTPTEAALDAVLQAVDGSKSDKALAKAVREAIAQSKDQVAEDDAVTVYDPDAKQVFGLGEKMEYTDGKTYTSKLSENTWTPEEYPAGWELVEEEKRDER